ncbi:hypothetical protein CCR94_16510 [Rhodoblastus sphagnicola]|uniref:ParB-like N-terminal domain-containing protein n=1 Tax=Rhodoblastus sphagnicola TaxID=333368 RepID=A0A2S6N323_9HYPH|nr:ParB N-terminal domain-containing protein [Rhodoblastus sphagnicola]MBB4199101.1 ParB family chromosome partitioning protein [Rhodoblastus sphagnicola]PPQ28992.1 hypothetical protein CCR94_16510 [Rhodoblastus sphagnicola]
MAPPFIDITSIDTRNRLRDFDPDVVEFIAPSIRDNAGKPRSPILVRPKLCDGFEYGLIFGLHRLECFRLLKIERLEVGENGHVIIRDMDDDQAQLAEIDENLMRGELKQLDLAMFVAARQGVYDRIYPDKINGKSRNSHAVQKSQSLRTFGERFSKNIARKLDVSERAIQYLLEISKLDEQAVRDLRGSAIEDNQRELLALAKRPADEQRQIAAAIRDGRAKAIAPALVAVGLAEPPPIEPPQKRIYAELVGAWDRADKITRSQFLEFAGLSYAATRGAKK